MKKYLSFLEAEWEPANSEDALFHVVSAPYEKTVSYGKGTKKGPAAIIKASQRLEAFDCISIPGEAGIYTHKPLDCGGGHRKALAKISAKVSEIFSYGKVPVLLGGEHTVTFGSISALHEILGKNFAVIQFDAHTDLRDSYQGTKFSHGCVMRRIYSDLGVKIFQIGIRSLSHEEHLFRIENNIPRLDADCFAFSAKPEINFPSNFPDNVFVTIDVDALDPSIMPATGTPEPGGLTWNQIMHCLSSISGQKNVIGFDLVELAPIKGIHAPDFTAARLIYNFMGMIARKKLETDCLNKPRS